MVGAGRLLSRALYHTQHDPDPDRIMKGVVKMKFMRKREKGFTLLEVMLVVIIIGIIAIIALPRLLVTRVTAGEKSCDSNLQALRTQIESYYWNEQVFPAVDNDLTTFIQNTVYFPTTKQVTDYCPFDSTQQYLYTKSTGEVSCPVTTPRDHTGL